MTAASSIPSLARSRGGETQSGEDQQIDRAVFEKIDAVGEERDRTDRERDGEFDPEVCQD